MNAALPKYQQTTLEDLINAISLLELEAGRIASGLREYQTITQSGQQAFPASLSVLQDLEKAKTTNATFSHISSNWSDSASLTESLVNRLKERLGTDGSMIYRQQWKQKVTPSGIAYWAHTASARSIKDKGCTGWPTARANDSTGAKLTGWPTTSTRDHKGGYSGGRSA